MNQHFRDLLDLSDTPPTFWEKGGVPRFAPFEPEVVSDIYADEVALVEIACQCCDTRFKVAFTSSRSSRTYAAMRALAQGEDLHEAAEAHRIENMIRGKGLHYGDPPNICCCAAGPSMNSDTVQVLEFHKRNHPEFVENGVVTDLARYQKWRRIPDLERKLESAWS